MKPASTIFVYHTGFLPAAIRFHMKLWRLITRRKYSLPWNHVEKIIPIRFDNWNKYYADRYGQPKVCDLYFLPTQMFVLMSCSARENGAEMTPLSVYLESHQVNHIREPLNDISLDQCLQLEQYAIDMCIVHHRAYEKVMFLKWVKRIQTLGGYNPKHTDDKQVYCYEIVNEFDKLIGLAPDQDGLVDVYQLWENPKFD